MEMLAVGSIVREFEDEWSEDREPEFSRFLSGRSALDQRVILVELIRSSVELRARKGLPVDLDSYLRLHPELRLNPGDVLELLYTEYQVCRNLGRDLDKTTLLRKYPDLSTLIEDGFSDLTEAHHPGLAREKSSLFSRDTPEQISHYRIERVLGRGSFGAVYLASDLELGRKVAVKVPRPDRVYALRDLEAYKNEARNLARLDQPGILPILAVGFDEKYPFYLVTKYLEGEDLATRLKREVVPFRDTARWLASVAHALRHAHARGLVHRDIKPANILIDRNNEPWILDFGLALRDDQVGFGKTLVGTPVYMSPEQARRQGHRIDGRSDIFSLGVVLYEMLCNRKPFQADNLDELIRLIVESEPRPPRQRNESIPRELERICLKALSKQARDRYQDAAELARDLESWLETVKGQASAGPGQVPTEPGSSSVHGSSAHQGSDPWPSRVDMLVPRGLRSFDTEDAGFFLGLLPGPRDRDGLPESVRYWKKRMEAVQGFPVGLLYGPSGCGKSSLAKAGLVPALDTQKVVPLYLECAPQRTERRLETLVRQACGIDDSVALLPDLFFQIRQGAHQALRGRKLVLVLDQFEQWLHERNGTYRGGLTEALGQCDGIHIQALLLVRDDFWMAANRFMKELEIELEPEANLQAFDLFDKDHAEKVLTAIGRASGKLPAFPGHIPSAQKRFLQRAVEELSQENRVVTVRLTLLAEMMRHRDWTLEELRSVGGVGGLVVTFLEETFEGRHSSPEYRASKEACQGILGALVPDSGSVIRGASLPARAIETTCGGSVPPGEFRAALRILEKDLRLVTRTSGDTAGQPDAPAKPGPEAEELYQVTHDYLVPGIRDWLLRKRRQTAAGRARILLEERAGQWQVRKDPRFLPSLVEYLKIQWFTRGGERTTQQRGMLRQAGIRQARRIGLVAVLMLMAWLGLWQWYGSMRAESLTRQLVGSRPSEVLPTARLLEPYLGWARPLLQRHQQGSTKDAAWLPATIALLPGDPTLAGEIVRHLADIDQEMLPVIATALSLENIPDDLPRRMWDKALDGQTHEVEKLRTLSILARVDAESGGWEKAAPFLAAQLTGKDAAGFLFWKERLQPVGKSLIPSLITTLDQAANGFQARSFALEALLDYAREEDETLFSLLARSPLEFLQPVVDTCLRQPEFHIRKAVEEINGGDVASSDLERADKWLTRRANLAIFLLNTDRRDLVWPMLRPGKDPSLRTEIINALPKTGCDPCLLMDRLSREQETPIRSALLLCLGSFPKTRIHLATRNSLAGTLLVEFANNPDPGFHGAAEWLLRQWGFDREIETAIADLRTAGPTAGGPGGWKVSTEGLTLVRIPGGTVRTGSPETEKERMANESPHQEELENDLYISSTEITRELFKRYLEDNRLPLVMEATFFAKISFSIRDPEVAVSWFDAARFCNWLSRREGIPETEWCYEPASPVAGVTDRSGGYTEGMVIRSGYRSLRGYRLPTVTEWEHACRAGTISAYHFGNHRRQLVNYAWFNENSQGRLRPVDSLKPNDWGLFGCAGNAIEWCQNTTVNPYSGDQSAETVTRTNRVFRGGSIGLDGAYCRSAARNSGIVSAHAAEAGFRVVRKAD